MKPTMLLLTTELPYPLQSGGKVKTWNMISYLSKDWDITLVCPLKESDSDHVEAFRQKAPIKALYTDSIKVPRTASNLLKSYSLGIPLNVFRTRSTAISQQVESIIDGFDWVLVDHYEAFQFVPNRLLSANTASPKLVYHAHNAYHQFWSRYAKTTNNIAEKMVCFVEYWRVRRHEKNVCAQADLCFAAPNDIQTLQAIGCEADKFRETLHLGDDNNLELAELQVANTSDKLCYAGLLSWEPNVQGLVWFLEKVWPTLKLAVPQLSLDIAGKNPDKRLVDAVNKSKGVSLLGFVDDLENLYKGSRMAICPLLFGSGIKVKVANAMARGLPMVTTTVGAEGLAVTDGEHIMIAATADQTINAILAVMVDDALWLRLSRQSRRLMAQRYTWRALFIQMNKEINALLRREPQAASAYAA